MFDENKTNDEIIAEALIQIIENQVEIKKHLGIARDYDSCYYDNQVIEQLRKVE